MADPEQPSVEEDILRYIDENTPLSVDELATRLGVSETEVQHGLERLMERGKITSTPDWRYRKSRRINDDE